MKSEFDPIEFLVRCRFPRLSLVGVATLGERKRTTESGADLAAMAKEAALYREELGRLSSSEIDMRVDQERKRLRLAEEQRIRREEAALWFNQPDVAADFGYWAAASYWTQDEAVALSLGKEPRQVTWEALSPYLNKSPLANDFADRRLLVQRAVTMQQLYTHTLPPFFLAWARRTKMQVPPELEVAVEALGQQIADWKTFYDAKVQLVEALQERLELEKKTTEQQAAQIAELDRASSEAAERVRSIIAEKDSRIAELESGSSKSAASRERQSLLKLVIGMAIKGYGHNPDAARTSTSREISSDLQLIGLSLDEDTIRRYLTEAKDLLP
tara:strand:- start:41456 stop:42442 length:987 start_codon:yes stop_codon:yes gene_type:complete